MAPLSYSCPVTTRGLSAAAVPGLTKLSRTPTISASPATARTKFAAPKYSGFASARQAPSTASSQALPNLMGAGRAARAGVLARRGSFAEGGSQGPKVVCYGDSLTAGFGRGGNQFTPYGTSLREGLISAGVQCDVTICGQTGHTAKQMVRELDAQMTTDQMGMHGKGLRCMIREGAELVVIMAGTNDLGSHFDPCDTFQNICQLHAACHDLGVPTLAVAPPHFAKRPEQARLTQMLKTWAEQEPLVKGFVDIEEFVPHSARQLWDFDKLHFSPMGSQQLGRQLSHRIAKLLDTDDTGSPPRKIFAGNAGGA